MIMGIMQQRFHGHEVTETYQNCSAILLSIPLVFYKLPISREYKKDMTTSLFVEYDVLEIYYFASTNEKEIDHLRQILMDVGSVVLLTYYCTTK